VHTRTHTQETDASEKLAKRPVWKHGRCGHRAHCTCRICVDPMRLRNPSCPREKNAFSNPLTRGISPDAFSNPLTRGISRFFRERVRLRAREDCARAAAGTRTCMLQAACRPARPCVEKRHERAGRRADARHPPQKQRTRWQPASLRAARARGGVARGRAGAWLARGCCIPAPGRRADGPQFGKNRSKMPGPATAKFDGRGPISGDRPEIDSFRTLTNMLGRN
jgi:hypothetical protein